MLKALVACEESQAVCIELRCLGWEAYSCDIIECSGGHPEWHIRQDVLPLINGDCEFYTMDGVWHEIKGEWDFIIAFPPCTHLATSGARHFEKKRADGRQRKAIEFFCAFLDAKCKRIAIENPKGIMSGGEYIKTHFPDLAERYGIPRPYTQVVQPWWFAKNEEDKENYHEKATCLWMIGLVPIVVPLVWINAPERYTTSTGKTFPAWYCKPSLRCGGNRQKVRSKTFPGIARAIAEQVTAQIMEEQACKQ